MRSLIRNSNCLNDSYEQDNYCCAHFNLAMNKIIICSCVTKHKNKLITRFGSVDRDTKNIPTKYKIAKDSVPC